MGKISHLVGCAKLEAILTFTVLINFGLLRRGHWCWSRFDPSLHQNSGSNFLRIGWGWEISYFPGLIVHGLNNHKVVPVNLSVGNPLKIKKSFINKILVYFLYIRSIFTDLFKDSNKLPFTLCFFFFSAFFSLHMLDPSYPGTKS